MKTNFEIPIWIWRISIDHNMIKVPDNISFTSADFLWAMRGFGIFIEELRTQDKLPMDSYYLNDNLTEKSEEASHCILGLLEDDYQRFTLEVGLFKETEAGRVMRNLVNKCKIRFHCLADWSDEGKIRKLSFVFSKTGRK